jgi:DNA-binding Lrp family transcriptional regulator
MGWVEPSEEVRPVTAPSVLDAVDAVLIRELQIDGRATYEALAQHVGRSRTAVRARVQNLLEQGAVRVVGVVHPAVADTGAIGHVAVTVNGSARQVAEQVAARSAVRFASVTVGPYSLVTEVRARDDATLAAEIDEIRRTPGVQAAEVFRAVSVIKDAYSIVDEPSDLTFDQLIHLTLDEIDWWLLRELQRHGRAPYTRLAHTIGLSQAATRARVVRLLRSSIIRVIAIANPSATGTTELAGFGLLASGAVDAVAGEVAGRDGVHYLVTGFGRYDILGHAEATSRAALVGVLDAIRAVPGVTLAETWHHLDIVKAGPPRGRANDRENAPPSAPDRALLSPTARPEHGSEQSATGGRRRRRTPQALTRRT